MQSFLSDTNNPSYIRCTVPCFTCFSRPTVYVRLLVIFPNCQRGICLQLFVIHDVSTDLYYVAGFTFT